MVDYLIEDFRVAELHFEWGRLTPESKVLDIILQCLLYMKTLGSMLN